MQSRIVGLLHGLLILLLGMSKIIIDAREYSTSTGRYISKLISNLEKVDNDNIYVVLLKDEDFNKVRFTNPNFSSKLTQFKEFSLGEQLGFAKQLYSLKADLVHYGMPQQPILYFKRSVTTVHDLTTARFTNPDKNKYVFFVKQQVYKFVVRYAALKSKKILTDSSYVKNDLTAFGHINSSKISVAYAAADKIANAAQPIKKLVGKDFVMYIGRPMPHKNLWRLVEAFVALKDKHQDLHLVLAGKMDNNYRNIEKRVEESGIKDVIFTDFVSEGELRWLYQNCKAYVFPSLSEGFGLPGLEAMAHGAPVVSSNATCLPEIYGDAAYYFDPLDINAITSSIDQVISDDSLRSRLIEAGYKQVKLYSWEVMAKQTLDVYNQALKGL